MHAGADASPLRRAVAALWAADPGRMAFALRLTLVACAVTLVVMTFEIPNPALGVYLVLFLNRPDRTTSVLLAIVMLLLISFLIAFLLPLSSVLIDDPLWRVTAMAALSFAFVFLGSASRLKPFAGTTALLTAYVLDLLGTAPGGEIVTRGLLYAWLFVAVPAGVSVLADLLVAPAPRRLAGGLLARALRASATMLEAPMHADRTAFERLRREVATGVPALIGLGRLERTLTPRDREAFAAAARATTSIMACVDLIRGCPIDGIDATLRAEVASQLLAMADILQRGGYPADVPGIDAQGEVAPEARHLVHALHEAMTGFASPAWSEPPAPPAVRSGFFVPDAFSNPTHVRHALKVTLAAMSCYLLFELWDWPGIHTAMITCFIVSLGTAAETVEKLSLRVAGCLAGAAAGLFAIVVVLPSVTSITGLVIVVGAGMACASWVAAGDERISYAGFQIAFAFLMCVLQGTSPGFDLSIARDRVVGILLGDLVVYLVFSRIWPVSVAGRVDVALQSLLDLLARIAASPDATRRMLFARAVATRSTLARDVELARFEPPAIRPTRTWVAARRDAVEAIGRLEAPLLVSPPRDLPAALERCGRLVAGAEDRRPSTLVTEAAATDCTSWAARTALAELEAIISQEWTHVDQAPFEPA